jgi:hypothetical protein
VYFDVFADERANVQVLSLEPVEAISSRPVPARIGPPEKERGMAQRTRLPAQTAAASARPPRQQGGQALRLGLLNALLLWRVLQRRPGEATSSDS